MLELNRREFLRFVGGGAALAATGTLSYVHDAHAAPVPLTFTPVRLPHPLEIFTTNSSFLATGLGGLGVSSPASATAELAAFTVIDDVVVPPEFERYMLLAWGDRPFPNPSDYVGYNHDFTAYIPLVGINDGLLWVNHEYTSYPFHESSPGTSAAGGNPAFGSGNRSFETVVVGVTLPTLALGTNPGSNLALVGEQLYNVGGSIVRIRRAVRGGRFAAVNGDIRNRRVHGLSGVGLNLGARVGVFPAAWGALPHQIGDTHHLIGTGPAAIDVFIGVDSDGLGDKIIGTISNCSGGTTPWGTIMSGEENFQGSGSFTNASTSYPFYGGVTEGVTASGTQSTGTTGVGPTGYTANTAGAMFGLVGEKYGWLVEIDPRKPVTDQAGRGKKHTALGRFRHENMAMRCEAGSPLVVYSGDDRRGGHTWKYVSDGIVTSVTNPANSALLESGTLYVARFNPDGALDASGTALNGTGQWIPIRLSTLCNPQDPDLLASVQLTNTPGTTEANGRINLPARATLAGSGATVSGGFFNLNRANRNTINPGTGLSYYDDYRIKPAIAGGGPKTLADFYSSIGAALVDAFGAGGLVGGTPCARPEDIEVHPITKEVFIAMTDGRPGGDGYPDSRIFVTAKYNTGINTTQQSGGLYKIVEGQANGAGTTFTWARASQAGEDGTVAGSGFANIDNLAFDSKMNLWVVTDMTTGLHNGVQDGPVPATLPITHGNAGGSNNENLVGVYGNNWLFYIPTTGVNAGTVVPFAVGPVRCEMTGPTFVGDTLLVSVQHPSEDSPTGAAVTSFTRSVEMLKLDGSGVFSQTRTVPTGSNWPSNIEGNPTGYPKPCTIGIRRKNCGSFL